MATVIQDKDLDKTQGGSMQSQPQGPATPQQPPVVQANQPSRVKQQGSGFTNLNTVVNANRNNRLGQAVAGGVQQGVQNARTGVQNAQQNFQSQAKENELGTQEQRNQRDQFINNAVSNPSELTDQDVQQNQKFLSGRYGGPQGLENSDTLVNKAREAENLGQLTGSTAGRSALLSRFAGGNNGYTAGQSRLDNTLLGLTAGQDLSRARREALGTGQMALQATTGAQNQAQQLGQQAQQFGAETGQKLGQATSGITDVVNQNLTAAQKLEDERSGKYTEVKDALEKAYNGQDPTVAADALKKALSNGLITQDQAKNLQGQLALSQFVSGGAGTNINPAADATWKELKYLESISDKTPEQWSRQHGLTNNLGALSSLQSQVNSGNINTSGILDKINKSLTQNQAQNLSVAGLADQKQRAQLNALSRLSGQSDQFTMDAPAYSAGSTSYDPTGQMSDAASILQNLGAYSAQKYTPMMNQFDIGGSGPAVVPETPGSLVQNPEQQQESTVNSIKNITNMWRK